MNNCARVDSIFYQVQVGDSLSKIIRRYYGVLPLSRQSSIIETILLENPEIKNPDRIYPGQVLLMDVPIQYCEPGDIHTPVIEADNDTVKTLKENLQNTTPQERNMISHLAPIMIGTGSANLSMIEYTFKTNAPLISEIAESYNNYKNGQITKGQYDYQRRKNISRLKQKLGPTKLAINHKKPLNEILRISRKKTTSPVHVLNNQTKQMTQLSRLAAKGGTVLSVVGLGVACYDIAHTDNQQQKNEILVENIGSLAGGLLYGTAVTTALILMATPVGWIAALVIGAGGILASYTAGQAAKKLYSSYGSTIDLVSAAKLNGICN